MATTLHNNFIDLGQVIMVKPDLNAASFDLKAYLETIEINLINTALNQSRGVVSHAARILGLRRTTLIEKMKKYNIVKHAYVLI